MANTLHIFARRSASARAYPRQHSTAVSTNSASVTRCLAPKSEKPYPSPIVSIVSQKCSTYSDLHACYLLYSISHGGKNAPEIFFKILAPHPHTQHFAALSSAVSTVFDDVLSQHEYLVEARSAHTRLRIRPIFADILG